MDILVGCPVYQREWILPKWFDHVEEACAQAVLEPSYVFAVDRRDEVTTACLAAQADMRGRRAILYSVEDNLDRQEKRDWTKPGRIEHMVEVRNQLLEAVRLESPPFFLSVDSDILLHPRAITELVETAKDYDAVGGKVYLSKAGTRVPSFASLKHGRMVRTGDVPYVKKADVIMALKLMRPHAYSVDYEYDHNGEDIGWSKAVGRAGLSIGFDGRTASKHVWDKEFLDVYDRRCGF